MFAICRRVAGAGMDDRNLAEDADPHVVDRQAVDRHRPGRLLQKRRLIDQRPVRVGAQEIVGQDLLEAPHVAVLHRVDVVAVERQQHVEVPG